ncbi:MAG: tRNA uridine(34) 5-carboxymethylaminomethyl modification radical SAM/GNAT enzyme Elp3 [Candidatus Micrarchaeota archaeon]
MSRREAIDSAVRRLIAGERNLDRIKRDECRHYRIGSMLKNPELIEAFPPGTLTRELHELLLKKPSRTLSGVTPVAVMIRPQNSCRWGCAYCPFTGLAAKSYTGFEPAALRGRQYGFDPSLQASSRVRQFEGGGHPADKCEVIVMGGTFLETEPAYKRDFIKGIYDGLNGFRSASLGEAIAANERAPTHRAVGLTIETRPDVCVGHIGEMLSYGATRVELGVQHPDDEIYRLINRGHLVKDVVESTRALKDAAFKVLYHIMPGLPGSGKEKDVSSVRRIFEDGRFRPDMLKIYPTLVMKGTALHSMMERGEYSPYSAEEAADVISEFYRHIPGYVRVMRIQRDIPAGRIESGVKKSNLRELVDAKIKEKGIRPMEIRSREIGLRGGAKGGLEMRTLEYGASGGKELFLSFEDEEDLIAGFLRLRLPGVAGTRAFVRELHVYGSEVPLDGEGKVQHRGLGTRLLAEAERLAGEEGMKELAIISGVGVREYYRKRGYSLKGPYMCRGL